MSHGPGWREALVLDPGETTGYAFLNYADEPTNRGDGHSIITIGSIGAADLLGPPNPEGTVPRIREWVELVDVVVVEEFRLYRDKAMQLAGTTLPTVQVIGGIRAAINWSDRRPDLKFQGASDMRVIEAKLDFYGVEPIWADRQEKSAQLHAMFWYYNGRHRGKDRPI